MARQIPSQVKDFYSQAPLPHRKTMLEMRTRILEIIPAAEEVVSYGMPAFELDGVVVAGLMSHKSHVGYYPFSGSILKLFPDELAKYKQTLSALHVPVDKPLPKGLLKKLIKARINL